MNIYWLNLKLLLLVVFSLFCINNINAQVSIGSQTPPAKADLLEIKNKEPTNESNETSDKGGLGLPRVSLVNRKTLEPFVKTTDTDWTNPTAKIKKKHTGLTVYNVTETNKNETDINKIFYKGIYVWDGEEWYSISNTEHYFLMPAFNLPLISITRPEDPKSTFDLYAEYKKQFTKNKNPLFKTNDLNITNIPSPDDDKLYSPEELDYVVIDYDDAVIDDIEITDKGVMKYNVKDTDPLPTSFINILFVIK